MIIQLEKNSNQSDLNRLFTLLESNKIKYSSIQTQSGSYIVGIVQQDFDIRKIGKMNGVKDVHRVTDNYKLVSSKWKVNNTTIDLGDGIKIGAGDFTLMAGPCSIESEDQIEQITNELLKCGIKIMRGGVYKPRSSPYSYRGMGLEGLKLFHTACRKKGIKIITEVMQVSQIEEMVDYVDIFQVGARNTQNFNLLDALGSINKPVLIKRGIAGTIDELLQSAEYIFSAGNEKLILCERGIRTFENAYRNTFDINAIPLLKEKSHLPVIADPSHGIGIRRHVEKITLASMIAGADGAIIEIHPEPEIAMSDGQQTLNFEEFEQLNAKIKALQNTMVFA